jgi:hypothetical protein
VGVGGAEVDAGLLELALVSAGRVAGVLGVRDAVRDALAPWALGEGDPLADRVGDQSKPG